MIKDLHFRVCDKGLFLPIARRLARDAGHVSYWTPCDTLYPSVLDSIGDGFDDIDRVDCFLEDWEKVDCFVFPDVGFAGLQEMLAGMGKPVWGSGCGDQLEISRGLFLDTLKQTGLPVPKYEKIKGLSNLRAHLAGVEDRWIKVSKFRGDWETFHWIDRATSENQLDRKAIRLGPFREHITFFVFEPIEAEIEDGVDSWNIDGQFPEVIVHGMESKDKAFVGTFQRFADLPEEVRKVSEAFAPVLAEHHYRSFFSTEIRITADGRPYFIDPTCRAGSPPSQCMAEMIANYTDIIWGGANGQLVEPEDAAKFGVQALVSIKGHSDCWRYLKVDDELDRWLKCGHCVRDGDYLAIRPLPEPDESDVGWLVGIGDTIAEAIRHLKHNVELLPECATCEFESLADLLSEVQEAEEMGMEFTSQPVPDPETILKD